MATAVQIRDAVDDAILARLENNAIDEYSMQDGRRIKRTSLSDLLKVRELYHSAAQAETNGSPLSRIRYYSDHGALQ